MKKHVPPFGPESADTLVRQHPTHGTIQKESQRVTPHVAPKRPSHWAWPLTQRLALNDLVMVSIAAFGGQVLRIGETAFAQEAGVGKGFSPGYSVVSASLVIVWMGALRLTGARDHRVLGYGPEEFSRVFTACLWMLGTISFASFALRLGLARGYVAIMLPLGTILLLLSRLGWRRWLTRRREQGQLSATMLAVGTETETARLRRHLDDNHAAGFLVVGEHHVRPGESLGADAIAAEADRLGVQSVLVGAGAGMSQAELRDLMWLLADQGRDVVVASSLTGVSGPRAKSRPVEGLPLMQVEAPTYRGGMWLVKETFDRLSSGIGLLILSPLLVLVALVICLDSPGSPIYKQERIGVDGRSFRIWKFRSMRKGADADLQALLEASGSDGKPLFKPENDPRITRVGRFIRKYSIDELPQLVNVFKGDMSVVGPRPQVPAEVALYDGLAHKRLKTKPGITGLWQVSGRSDLAWEEAVLLDLHYVENWSLGLDIALIWRTIFVVAEGRGAR